MAQTYTANCFATSNKWDDDLQNLENNFAALRSAFSGAAAPSSPVEGQIWMDTGSNALKRRNAGNTAWLADLIADADQKVPVYRNDTCDGWLIDSTVTDRIVALKGGTGAFNANGGTNAGTAWSILAAGHTHGAGSYAPR